MTIGLSGDPLAPTIGIGAATKKPSVHAVGRAVGRELVEVEQLADEQAEVAQRGDVPREEFVARLGRHDRARGGVGRDHRDVVIVQPRDRARRDARLAARRPRRAIPARGRASSRRDRCARARCRPRRPSTPCARGRAVELVGTDREAGLEVLDAEVARDVEQHRRGRRCPRARWCTPRRRAPPVAVTRPAQ